MNNNSTKTLFLIFSILFFTNLAIAQCPNSGAIICDDFESYADGSTTGGQAAWWTTWSGTLGGAEDGIVSTDYAASGNNSMLIAEGQAQDVIMLLGNQSSGVFNLKWKTYIPANATGYYNIQEDETPAVAWNLDVFYNLDGNDPGTGTVDQSGNTFSYPEDTWFDVVHIVDLDNDELTLMIDGNLVETTAYTGNLGSIDFFSIDAANRYYIDDVSFVQSFNVTFNVNMNDGVIIVDPGGAHIAGEMNGWSGEPMSDNGDGTYTATFTLMSGDTVEYKFQNGLDGWENNVPGDCSLGGFGNRYVVVGDTDMDLDLVCFDQCTDCVVATKDLEFSTAISISPNPAKGSTNLFYDFDQTTDLEINLMNNLGQRIKFQSLDNVQSGNYSISLENLVRGIYFIHVTDGESNVVEKIIVE